MSAGTLHITLAQLNPVVGDLDHNLAKIRKVRDEAPAGTDLIVYSEMIVTGYQPEDLVLKPFFLEQVGQAVQTLAHESKKHKPWLLLSCPWQDGAKRYNALHLIGDGKIQATRYKHNLPNYGVFDELRVFQPGPLPDPIDVKGHKIGAMVCEDGWYPDVAAHLKKQGAEILVIANGSPYELNKTDTRLHHARLRVEETGLPVIYVNQIGGQDELVFDGASFVLNEQGHKVLQADEFCEEIHHTVWERAQDHWLCLTDTIAPERPRIASVYQALVTGLRDYVTKNRFPGVLIGLSGGIDSALSAAIAVDALGHESVRCVMMPSPYTSQESLDEAAACAKALGVKYEIISIEPAMKAFSGMLAESLPRNAPGITFENIQSRARGVTLMALSNATGAMVLSTGNKSEVAVGYATLYGDMCGGFNVLKDIYKTQVYELARWRNGNRPDHGFGPSGVVIPARTLTRAPSAELRPDQTDQDTLPPYDILDDILECLIERDMGLAEIVRRGHAPDLVKKVWNMLDTAEYKRRQAAPGVKITSRAFGRDRRYPITNRFALNVKGN